MASTIALLLACLSWPVGSASAPAPDGYRAVPIRGPGSMARLRADLGEARFAALLAVNRIDADHVARADTLIVPPAGRTLLELSPLPPTLAAADSLPHLLLVSLRVQAFAAYDSGLLVRWGPICSGGHASPTSPREYRANWKEEVHVSTVDSTWIMRWCVNLDNRVGTALHQYALPGRPDSHCCIRLLENDARWVYGWIVLRATPVLVFGAYDFDAPAPWLRLPADPDATLVDPAETGLTSSL